MDFDFLAKTMNFMALAESPC